MCEKKPYRNRTVNKRHWKTNNHMMCKNKRTNQVIDQKNATYNKWVQHIDKRDNGCYLVCFKLNFLKLS